MTRGQRGNEHREQDRGWSSRNRGTHRVSYNPNAAPDRAQHSGPAGEAYRGQGSDGYSDREYQVNDRTQYPAGYGYDASYPPPRSPARVGEPAPSSAMNWSPIAQAYDAMAASGASGVYTGWGSGPSQPGPEDSRTTTGSSTPRGAVSDSRSPASPARDHRKRPGPKSSPASKSKTAPKPPKRGEPSNVLDIQVVMARDKAFRYSKMPPESADKRIKGARYPSKDDYTLDRDEQWLDWTNSLLVDGYPLQPAGVPQGDLHHLREPTGLIFWFHVACTEVERLHLHRLLLGEFPKTYPHTARLGPSLIELSRAELDDALKPIRPVELSSGNRKRGRSDSAMDTDEAVSRPKVERSRDGLVLSLIARTAERAFEEGLKKGTELENSRVADFLQRKKEELPSESAVELFRAGPGKGSLVPKTEAELDGALREEGQRLDALGTVGRGAARGIVSATAERTYSKPEPTTVMQFANCRKDYTFLRDLDYRDSLAVFRALAPRQIWLHGLEWAVEHGDLFCVARARQAVYGHFYLYTALTQAGLSAGNKARLFHLLLLCWCVERLPCTFTDVAFASKRLATYAGADAPLAERISPIADGAIDGEPFKTVYEKLLKYFDSSMDKCLATFGWVRVPGILVDADIGTFYPANPQVNRDWITDLVFASRLAGHRMTAVAEYLRVWALTELPFLVRPRAGGKSSLSEPAPVQYSDLPTVDYRSPYYREGLERFVTDEEDPLGQEVLCSFHWTFLESDLPPQEFLFAKPNSMHADLPSPLRDSARGIAEEAAQEFALYDKHPGRAEAEEMEIDGRACPASAVSATQQTDPGAVNETSSSKSLPGRERQVPARPDNLPAGEAVGRPRSVGSTPSQDSSTAAPTTVGTANSGSSSSSLSSATSGDNEGA